MSEYVFLRYEIKYVIDENQYLRLIEFAENRLKPDNYGKTNVQSLYFDTNDFRLIRRSIEKPFYKEKLRLRHYGFTDENAFLELKKKCNGIVFKRRIKTSVTGYNVDVMKNEQISKEISYFMRFYKNLSPKILITYDRTAFVGTGDLRITFDRNIAYRTNNLDFFKKSNETRITDFGKILMEIKTGGAIPLWLTAFLDREKIYKTSSSKCGEAYKKEIIKTKTEVAVSSYGHSLYDTIRLSDLSPFVVTL